MFVNLFGNESNLTDKTLIIKTFQYIYLDIH